MIDLKSVVEKYPECLDSATKFKSYMMDLYPDNSNKARIRILADIVDCGIALAIKNGKTDSISISNFCNTMENQYGYSTKLVGECVNQFLSAFRFNLNEEMVVNREEKNMVITSVKSKDKTKYVCNLDEFVISDGILKKYIGHSEYIAIPENVSRIGENAFLCCQSIIGVFIPNSVNHIDIGAFSYCRSLTDVFLPDSITEISAETFYDCKSITHIDIPKSITQIGNRAFKGCNHLKNIIIPNSVARINDEVFYGCYSLNSIVLPNNITYLGWGAFVDCTSLSSIDVPTGFEELHCTFQGCTSLDSVIIPSDIINIGGGTFARCSNLRNVTLPNSVLNIESVAFYECSMLTSINIPLSVKNIEEDSFEGCNALKTVYFQNNEQKNKFAGCFEPNVKLVVLCEDKTEIINGG